MFCNILNFRPIAGNKFQSCMIEWLTPKAHLMTRFHSKYAKLNSIEDMQHANNHQVLTSLKFNFKLQISRTKNKFFCSSIIRFNYGDFFLLAHFCSTSVKCTGTWLVIRTVSFPDSSWWIWKSTTHYIIDEIIWFLSLTCTFYLDSNKCTQKCRQHKNNKDYLFRPFSLFRIIFFRTSFK
jgi:hypothetical protein